MRKALIATLIVVAMAVLTDFTAAAYTEYRLSRWLRTGTTLHNDPQVTLHGFPLVLQAKHGRFNQIEFRATERTGHRPSKELSAHLEGVHIGFSELLRGAASAVPVDHVESALRIDETTLGRLLGIADLQISEPAPSLQLAPPDELQPTDRPVWRAVLSGTVTLPNGEPIEANILTELSVSGSHLTITALETNPTQGIVLNPSPPADPAILERFSHTLDNIELPFGARPSEIKVTGTQVLIQGTLNNRLIRLDQLLVTED